VDEILTEGYDLYNVGTFVKSAYSSDGEREAELVDVAASWLRVLSRLRMSSLRGCALLLLS
jgi:hypothetical protein